MAISTSSGKMFSTFRKITTMQRVLFLLNREKLLHRRYMIIIEQPCSNSLEMYAFVIPSTLLLVFTIGRHLSLTSNTSRKWLAITEGIQHWLLCFLLFSTNYFLWERRVTSFHCCIQWPKINCLGRILWKSLRKGGKLKVHCRFGNRWSWLFFINWRILMLSGFCFGFFLHEHFDLNN